MNDILFSFLAMSSFLRYCSTGQRDADDGDKEEEDPDEDPKEDAAAPAAKRRALLDKLNKAATGDQPLPLLFALPPFHRYYYTTITTMIMIIITITTSTTTTTTTTTTIFLPLCSRCSRVCTRRCQRR